MMERFDFYDLYGYLAPGAVFLLLIWLPFAATAEVPWSLPGAGEIIVYGLVAYVCGYLLQSLADAFISDRCEVGRRYPSDIILDRDTTELSELFLDALRDEVSSRYQLAIEVPSDAAAETVLMERVETTINRKYDRKRREIARRSTKTAAESDPSVELARLEKERKEEMEPKNLEEALEKLVRGDRRDAFLRCRGAVLQSGRTSYVQQFQGRYAFFKGIGTATALSGSFYLGWGVEGVLRSRASWTLPVDVGIGFGSVLLLVLLGISWIRWNAARQLRARKRPLQRGCCGRAFSVTSQSRRTIERSLISWQVCAL